LINIEDHGAIAGGDPTVNATAIMAAIATGDTVYVPEKPFPSNKIITDIPLRIKGDGAKSEIISTSPDAAIVVTVHGSHEGTIVEDLSINPQTIGQGTNGLKFLIEPTFDVGDYMARFDLNRIRIGQFGKQGLAFDNPAKKKDGFFTGSVTKSLIQGGILCNYIGDSVNIEKNTIHGGNETGIYALFVPGANKSVFRDNNITTLGGGIALLQATFTTIENNNIEHPAYLGDYHENDPQDMFNAMVILWNCISCISKENTIITGKGHTPIVAHYGLAITGTSVDCHSWRDKFGDANARFTNTAGPTNTLINPYNF